MEKEGILKLLEVGVLLLPGDEEYESYSYTNVYDNKYGYYDEDKSLYEEADLDKAIARAIEYVQIGVERTYAIITNQGNCAYDSDTLDEVSNEFLSYDKADIEYCIAKINGKLVEDFLNLKKPAIKSQIYGEKIKSIPESLTAINDRAFLGCVTLNGIVLHSGIKSIGQCSFSGCGLRNITIPEGTETIGENAFSYCRDLYSVIIPDSVTEIKRGAFLNCENLMDVNIPAGLVSIEPFTFDGCLHLKHVDLANVKEIGEKAFAYSGLNEITMPNTVSFIDDWAFKGCHGLTIKCIPGSYAEKFAKENHIKYEYIYQQGDNAL